MTSLLPYALAVVALFAACRWGGRTLATHFQDGWEIAAVAVMGTAAFAAFWVSHSMAAVDGPLPALGLVLAGSGGLFAGYLRGERA